MRLPLKPILLAFLVVFILPLITRAVLYAFDDRPRRWSQADWSSIGFLPPAAAEPEARLLVLSGRTGGLKGLVAVHSWIVLKEQGATRWTRYDKVGWGSPIRINGWAPDGRWFSDPPRVIVDLRGAEAAAVIPKIQAAIAEYPYRNFGDYRSWPGPNSNTFIASVLRAVPELRVVLPPHALGRDFSPGPLLGLTDSGTGIQANLWGLLGVKLGWAEGLEINVLGLVAGFDVRPFGLKLPGFGRLGFEPAWIASAASSNDQLPR